LFSNYMDTKHKMKEIVVIILLIDIIHFLWMVMDPVSSNQEGFYYGINPNTLAGILGIFVLLMRLLGAVEKRQTIQKYYWLFFFLGIFIVIFTGSRNGVGSLLLALMLTATVGTRAKYILLLICSAVLFIISEAVAGNILEFSRIEDGTTGRVEQWIWSWERFKDSPIFGWGLKWDVGDYVRDLPSYQAILYASDALGFTVWFGNVHSAYLKYLVAGGLFAMLLFIYFLFKCHQILNKNLLIAKELKDIELIECIRLSKAILYYAIISGFVETILSSSSFWENWLILILVSIGNCKYVRTIVEENTSLIKEKSFKTDESLQDTGIQTVQGEA